MWRVVDHVHIDFGEGLILSKNKKAASFAAGGFSQDGGSATNARRQPD